MRFKLKFRFVPFSGQNLTSICMTIFFFSVTLMNSQVDPKSKSGHRTFFLSYSKSVDYSLDNSLKTLNSARHFKRKLLLVAFLSKRSYFISHLFFKVSVSVVMNIY